MFFDLVFCYRKYRAVFMVRRIYLFAMRVVHAKEYEHTEIPCLQSDGYYLLNKVSSALVIKFCLKLTFIFIAMTLCFVYTAENRL